MKISTGGPAVLVGLATLFISLVSFSGITAAAGHSMKMAQQGKAIAISRKKGNCMACHAFDEQPLPGNLGPPLIGMKARFPDKSRLRAQVWDATQFNADSAMPPFGRHKILSDDEIDKVVEYLYTL